jgi:sec-independent protein translocase protein TatC
MSQTAGEDKQMSFLDHLEELRWTLVRSVIAIVVVAILAFSFKNILFDLIIFGPKSVDFPTYLFFCRISHWLGLDDSLCLTEMPFTVQNISMAGQFTTHIVSSLIAGLVVAFPYVVWEFWRFLKPGLRPTEQKAARGMVFFSSMLFLMGVSFGYYVIAPLSVQFLGGYKISESVENQIQLLSYISTVTTATLSAGLVFQLPILIYFLARIGIVTPEILRKYRRHALVAVLVLSAVITPPDITSQILVAIPIMVLYEVSILIAKRVVKRMSANNRNL